MRRDDGQILEANAAAASAYGYTMRQCAHDSLEEQVRARTAELSEAIAGTPRTVRRRRRQHSGPSQRS